MQYISVQIECKIHLSVSFIFVHNMTIIDFFRDKTSENKKSAVHPVSASHVNLTYKTTGCHQAIKTALLGPTALRPMSFDRFAFIIIQLYIPKWDYLWKHCFNHIALLLICQSFHGIHRNLFHPDAASDVQKQGASIDKEKQSGI